jgi:SAM-dependent methyltransferase
MGLLKSLRKKRRKQQQKAEYRREFEQFRQLATEAGGRLSVEWEDRYPCLDDKSAKTRFDRHYVYHTAWATRVLARTKPELHIDVSSSVYFSALASAIVPVRQYEFRPPELQLDGLEVVQGDLMKLPLEDHSVKSLSCMHVVEHVGLARYGDPMDADGDLKAIAELKRVLAPGGQLLFVVPAGRPRIEFNAHRIYSFEQIRELFKEFELQEFALIPDKAETGHLVYSASPELCAAQKYACGCFLFKSNA